jgi:anti-sigma factor RsiW
MPCADSLRVQAWFDGETDAVLTAEIERHVEDCAECRMLLRDLEQTRVAIRKGLELERAPPALHARVRHALEREASGAVGHERACGSGADARPSRLAWRAGAFWIGALSGFGAAAALAALLWTRVLAPAMPGTGELLGELVTAHVRSLMADHLIDVRSTDRHTVRPWFAGRVDVSPVVADFASQGYPLLGGRVDHIGPQRAAVTVYRHGLHVIEVFGWAAGRDALPPASTRRGYHLACWRDDDVSYCAVSDAGWDELLMLERLLEAQGSAERAPAAAGRVSP